MGSESKKQVIYAMAGVLVACLVIASVTTLPLFKPVTHEPSELLEVHELVYLSGWQEDNPRRLNTSFVLYEFTEPLGLGSEANITVRVTPNYNETFVVRVRLSAMGGGFNDSAETRWPRGISLADGESKWIWIGDLGANVTKTFNLRLKANEVGYGHLRADVGLWKYYTPEMPNLQKTMVDLDILVLEDNILVASIVPLPRFFDPSLPDVAGPRCGIIDVNWRYDWDTWSTPMGVGSEANLTFSIGSNPDQNATDVTLKILLPSEIELVEGETTWTGNIPASISFPVLGIPMRIRTTKLGTWPIAAYLEKDGFILDSPGILEISVFENRTTARRIW